MFGGNFLLRLSFPDDDFEYYDWILILAWHKIHILRNDIASQVWWVVPQKKLSLVNNSSWLEQINTLEGAKQRFKGSGYNLPAR
jgi:hypothetical protein